MDLSNKDITSIEGIGKFVNLKHPNISRSQLTTLPIEMTNLHSLVILDLRGNNIAESGDGTTTVGKKDLRKTFGKRVIFDDDDGI